MRNTDFIRGSRSETGLTLAIAESDMSEKIPQYQAEFAHMWSALELDLRFGVDVYSLLSGEGEKRFKAVRSDVCELLPINGILENIYKPEYFNSSFIKQIRVAAEDRYVERRLKDF